MLWVSYIRVAIEILRQRHYECSLQTHKSLLERVLRDPPPCAGVAQRATSVSIVISLKRSDSVTNGLISFRWTGTSREFRRTRRAGDKPLV